MSRRKISFLNVRFRAFAQATEVPERVMEAVRFASGAEEISISLTEGHFGNEIRICDAELTGSKPINVFLNRLAEAGVLASLATEAESRTDDDCVFHIRLDKQKAFLGALAITGSKDVIDVRMKVAVYPARRDVAIELVREWLRS